MLEPSPPSRKPSYWVIGCAVVWVTLFLSCFYSQGLPNNSSSAEALTRGDIGEFISVQFATLLNPLDYTSSTSPRSGWQNLAERVPFIRTAAVLWLAAWTLGRLAVNLILGPIRLLKSERIVLDFGVGISLLTLWTLLCGLAGLLHTNVLLAPSGAVSLLLLMSRLTRSRSVAETWVAPRTANPEKVHRGLLFLLIIMPAPFVLHVFLGGMTPPFDFDVCEYHLQGPKEWLQSGRIRTLKHNVYTSFPFLSEMLSLHAMVLQNDWWRGAIAGKLALTSFQFLSAVSVFAICQRWIGTVSGLIAVTALSSTPWTTRISIIAYAEGAITFYLAASIMSGLLVTATSVPRYRWRFVGLTGFLAGSAMAAKYPGLVSVVIPAALFVAWSVRESSCPTTARQKSESGDAACPRDAALSRRLILQYAVVFASAVLLAVGPWLAKNAAETGNPVYPLGYSVFGANDWSPDMDQKWQRAHSPDDHDVTRIPAHLMDVTVRSDWQNGFLFAFAVPALLMVRRQKTIGCLWAYVIWMLATWWALTHRIDRFWIPLIPVLAVLAGAAWQLNTSVFWRYGMMLILFMCCVFSYGFIRLPEIRFHAGLMQMAEARTRPVRQDLRLLNSTLPKHARVLMVGEAAVFNATFELVYNTVFDECIFEQWTSAAGSSMESGRATMKPTDEIRSVLREQNITHIYVNWSEILRYRQTYGYTEFVTPDRFTMLQSMGLLAAPITISRGDWTSLDRRQQANVSSWHGAPALMNGSSSWNSIQIYRVTL
ncbi:MAG: hypothetical protein GY826_09320 [Fuerstiella sp.]|nr:hypothetical protein [Fuerstiella sp.]